MVKESRSGVLISPKRNSSKKKNLSMTTTPDLNKSGSAVLRKKRVDTPIPSLTSSTSNSSKKKKVQARSTPALQTKRALSSDTASTNKKKRTGFSAAAHEISSPLFEGDSFNENGITPIQNSPPGLQNKSSTKKKRQSHVETAFPKLELSSLKKENLQDTPTGSPNASSKKQKTKQLKDKAGSPVLSAKKIKKEKGNMSQITVKEEEENKEEEAKLSFIPTQSSVSHKKKKSFKPDSSLKKEKLDDTPMAHGKSVHFDSYSSEKEHNKYVKTPFTESTGHQQQKKLKVEPIKQEKRKLSFSDSDISSSDTPNKKLKQNSAKKINSVASSTSQADKNREDSEMTIFVGNLPLTYTHIKVAKLFNKFGKVKNARIRSVPVQDAKITKRVSAIKKKFHEKSDSLAAYVVFKSKEDAESAFQANGMVIANHHIRVDWADRKTFDHNKAVFVGNLPFDVTDDELWNLFSACGKIVGVRVIRDRWTSMGKGIGYVNFESPESVELALHLDQEELKNRPINVKRCEVVKKKKRKLYLFKNEPKQNLGNKIKDEGKGVKSLSPSSLKQFQGKKAELKKKQKKQKISKDVLKKKKIIKTLSASPKIKGKA